MDVFDRIPRFKSCCIYVPLRTATVIISWFAVITDCLHIVVPAIILFSVSSNRELESKELHRRPEDDGSDFFWYLVMLTGLVSVIVGILGLVGINRNEQNYVKIFLIWKGIILSVEVLIALVNANVLLVLIFVFKGYLWLIVFSYYKEMADEKQTIAPTPT